MTHAICISSLLGLCIPCWCSVGRNVTPISLRPYPRPMWFGFGSGFRSVRFGFKACFLLLLVEGMMHICSNSGLLFCAVLSKTPFARMSAGAAVGDVCKVEVPVRVGQRTSISSTMRAVASCPRVPSSHSRRFCSGHERRGGWD